MVAAVKGYKLILVMPDSMSIERRRLMLAYGATFDLTPREKGMKGAIARAQELRGRHPGQLDPATVRQPLNVAVHERTTAQEILADFPEGLDVLITGVGSGGHLTGCARVLKAAWPNLKVYAVEPKASPVISGGQPSPHPIQGIGAGFIPGNLDTSLLDGVILVDAEDAREYGRRAAREEGMLVGILVGRDPDGHRPEAARVARWQPACWASATTRASVTCRSKATCPPERPPTPPEVPRVDRDCLRGEGHAPGPQCGTLLMPAMTSALAPSKRPAIVTRPYGGVKAEARRQGAAAAPAGRRPGGVRSPWLPPHHGAQHLRRRWPDRALFLRVLQVAAPALRCGARAVAR